MGNQAAGARTVPLLHHAEAGDFLRRGRHVDPLALRVRPDARVEVAEAVQAVRVDAVALVVPQQARDDGGAVGRHAHLGEDAHVLRHQRLERDPDGVLVVHPLLVALAPARRLLLLGRGGARGGGPRPAALRVVVAGAGGAGEVGQPGAAAEPEPGGEGPQPLQRARAEHGLPAA